MDSWTNVGLPMSNESTDKCGGLTQPTLFIRAIIPDLKLLRLDRVAALFVRNNETCKSDMIYRMTAINECMWYAPCYTHDLIATLIKTPSLSHVLAVLKLLFCSFLLLFQSYHDCAYDIYSRRISFFLLLYYFYLNYFR